MKIPPGTADFITRMFSDLQVWGERMSGRRSCGLRVDSGDSRQSARERPVLASGRQSDRRPNAKPRTLPASPAVPLRAAGRLWCGGLLQRSAESTARPPKGQACRPSSRLSPSLVTPTPPSHDRRPCLGYRNGMHSPHRDSAMEPLPARPGSPPAEKGDGW